MNESCLNIFVPLWVQKKIQSMHRGIFFLAFLVLCGCETSNSRSDFLSTEDYLALKSLFSHLLFYEGGAYTLFGSKPMTFEALATIPEEEKNEFLSFSSQPAVKDMLYFAENWNTWDKLKSQYSLPRFLLFQRNSPAFSPTEKSVFLVNITKTAGALLKYYEKFRDAVGDDFDPLNIVFEMEDNNSVFWNKILEREDLFGILLGFGEENSWFFTKVKAWQEQKSAPESRKASIFLESLASRTPGSNSLSLIDPLFPIPAFVCFAEEESFDLIRRYENQREMIKKIYRGNDLVLVTLDRLTSNDLSDDPDHAYREKLIKELGIVNQPGGKE